MNLYFSGIGGVGLAPLSMIALKCGFKVCGSDSKPGLSSSELEKMGIEITYQQSYQEIETAYLKEPFQWLIVTAALKQDHPHLQFAKEKNIKISKRDELLNFILKEKNLKLIAVAGTHGKTTTTAMIVWLFKRLKIPVSYLIGSSISFGPAGDYEKGSQYFVLECDEFDKNFLNFYPDISLVTSLDFDHPDTYPTQKEYFEGFQQFLSQAKDAIYLWNSDSKKLSLSKVTAKTFAFTENVEPNSSYLKLIKLAGEHNRRNGFLAISATDFVLKSLGQTQELSEETKLKAHQLNHILSTFPGTIRRFEKINNGLYSDYAHHPTEIESTIQLAKEVKQKEGFKKLVIVYQPHQNLRQLETSIQQGYQKCFAGADKLYWLPTFLSREPKGVEILEPQQIANNLEGFVIENNENELNQIISIYFSAKNNSGNLIGKFSQLNKTLQQNIEKELEDGNLVVAFGAGDIDTFIRNNFLN